ncbi:MAG TPA: cytochrome D1 domain-containing protein [Terracidiphilus sp.]
MLPMRLTLSALFVSLFALSVLGTRVSAQPARLLVAEKGQQSLAIVDPSTGKVLASVPEGGITGHEVIASPDGRLAYVPIYGNSGVGKPGTDGSTLVVIDIASHKVVNTLTFPHPVRPHCPFFGPKDGLLYVSTELDQAITLIDPKTLKIVGSIPTGQPQSHMFTLSHDGRRAYTANVGPGTVSVLDIHARKVLKVIPISSNTQRIAISPDDRWVFTADQTKPQLAVIDTRTNQLSRWIPLEGIAYGTAATPDGRFLLVTLPDQNKIAVVDLHTMQVVRSVPTGVYPQEIVVRPNGKAAYVSCEKSNQVAEIDLANWKLTRLIPTGKATDGLAWAAGH